MTIQLASQDMISRPHYVYAFKDSEGRVLYVGCTSNPGKRIKYDHQRKPWWPDVSQTEITEPMSRHDATILERTLIAKLRPVHNKQSWSPTTVRMLWRRDGKPANSPLEIFRDPPNGDPTK